MFKKKYMMAAIFLVIFLAMSAVSANDTNITNTNALNSTEDSYIYIYSMITN